VIFQSNELLPKVKALSEVSNIELVGKINHHDLLYWYNASDFIISTSHYEGSGIAVCEAMSCGCIPILSNIPSFRMMTKNGDVGILFKPGNVDDLKDALVKSTSLNIDFEKERVLNQFKENLSFEAISKKMIDAILKVF
jgi:glycosyltransferase involved in cell wall biosynthesis